MTDRELQHYVHTALEWEPSVDAADIGVTIDAGVVSLRGNVKSYAQRQAAERVALRVFGVKAVANELAVQLVADGAQGDHDIAQAILDAFKWNTIVPENRVSVSLSQGWVTLTGMLPWQFQKDAAARLVSDLKGVRGVSNLITVQPSARVDDIQAKIEAAFRRSAEIDARRIDVNVQGGHVTLSGNVHTWTEREEATRAAWAAPGVTRVEDRLAVVP